MNERLALLARFRSGTIDKHEYSRAMAHHHEALSEYAQLLAGSDIESIEISTDGIRLRSRLSAVVFPFDPTDRGTPCMVALNFGRYERAEFDMWRRLVPAGATVADIGANIGWYCAHMAAHDPGARIYAFEPVPTTFAWLQKMMAINKLPNVVVEQLAVADRAGTLVIHVDPTIAGAASAHPSVYGDTSKPVEVRATTLDDYAATHGLRIDAIKLDVEGGEFAVLKGATTVLASDRPMVFTEMLRRHARAFGYHPNDIIALMQSLGYACFYAAGDRLAAFHTKDDATAESNFFFLHRAAHDGAIASLADPVSRS
jgi:FkbM family methyltransferase